MIKLNKEGLYFKYLTIFKIERRKIKGFFTKFKSDNPKIIKQFLRFNDYLTKTQLKAKFTDRISYISAELPEVVKEHVDAKLLLLETIDESIKRFEMLSKLTFPFLTEQQLLNMKRRVVTISETINDIFKTLDELKREYEKRKEKVMKEYPTYKEMSLKEKKKVIDEDLKDIKKSKLNIEKVKYFYDRMCESMEEDSKRAENALKDFKIFLKALNIFMIRDHKTLKRIASRIKYKK